MHPSNPHSVAHATSRSQSPATLLFKPSYQPARRSLGAYRFKANSCLSQADLNLLLSKQASLAAQKKNYARAIALLSRLIACAPYKAEHYANRGLMHYSRYQYESALQDYNQALTLDPELDKAYNNRANLYATKQDWAAAIADYDTAIDLNPLNVRARLNQAITFREMGEYKEALICLDIAMIFQPKSPALYAERGRAYHLDGDWNCAIADYYRALTLASSRATESLSDDCTCHARTQQSALSRRVLTWLSSLEPSA